MYKGSCENATEIKICIGCCSLAGGYKCFGLIYCLCLHKQWRRRRCVPTKIGIHLLEYNTVVSPGRVEF
jgi:hypothetical protein